MKRLKIEIPVRFTGSDASQPEFTRLTLETDKTALLLVDCNGDCGEACNTVIKTKIAPALQAARAVGITGVFIYGDGWLPDGPASRASEYHRFRRKAGSHREIWRPSQPWWMDCIAPLDDEPTIAKKAQNAFVNSYLDTYLRSWAIETVLMVGFSFKSCLFYTIVGAFEHNYRVIFLRDGTDPPRTNEFSDTIDERIAEGGWVRLVLTRLIEDHLGYSSTCQAFMEACQVG